MTTNSLYSAVNVYPRQNQLGTIFVGSDRYAMIALQVQGSYIIAMILYNYEDIPSKYIEKTDDNRWILNLDMMSIDNIPFHIYESNIHIYKRRLKTGYWYQISSGDISPVSFANGADPYRDPCF